MGTYFSKTTEEFLFFYYTSHTFLFFCIAGKDIKIKWHSKSKVSVTTWDIMDTSIKLLQAAGSPYSAEKSSLPLCNSQQSNFISKLTSVQNVTKQYVIKRGENLRLIFAHWINGFTSRQSAQISSQRKRRGWKNPSSNFPKNGLVHISISSKFLTMTTCNTPVFFVLQKLSIL